MSATKAAIAAAKRPWSPRGVPTADTPGFHPARPPPQVELPFADEAPDFVANAPPKTSGHD